MKKSNFVIAGACVSPSVKDAALRALEGLDMSMSEYIRLSLAHLVEHGRPPFEIPPRDAMHPLHVPTRVEAGRETVAAV